MCLFPLPNPNIDSLAYRKGVTHFDCGACPECLRKRSGLWALRAVHECRDHAFSSMVCLTYDDYIRDSRGNVIGERVSDKHVDKRDCQLFMKRLRKYFSIPSNYLKHGYTSSPKIKYLICAEYGKHTHRPHYHAILFGVNFADCIPYKKSKRGNLIYKSATLTSLWSNGICTVDSKNVGAAAARYCTKYCAKDFRCEDTFMLSSQSIGLSSLITDFNGKSYIVEGREYPIPRAVWQYIISARYSHLSREFTYKYVNAPLKDMNDPSSRISRSLFLPTRYNDIRRARFLRLRDDDLQYQSYLDYWYNKSLIFKALQKPILSRINELPEDKYHFYKSAALSVYRERCKGIPVTAPRSGCIAAFDHFSYEVTRGRPVACPPPSRHNRASDTFNREIKVFDCLISDIPSFFPRKILKKQLTLFE